MVDWRISRLGGRHRRAVIPIIGKARGALFGVVAEENVESIRQRLRAIENGQKTLAQVNGAVSPYLI